MRNWATAIDKEFSKNENTMDVMKSLFDKGFFNSVFKNIGLSNNYTEDDLDVIYDYFKNHRNLPLSNAECFSRASFAIYICKIAEGNNKNTTWRIENSEKVKNDFEHGLVLEVKGKNDVKVNIFPIVKLGKIAFKKDNGDADLRYWYDVAMNSENIIQKIAKNI